MNTFGSHFSMWLLTITVCTPNYDKMKATIWLFRQYIMFHYCFIIHYNIVKQSKLLMDDRLSLFTGNVQGGSLMRNAYNEIYAGNSLNVYICLTTAEYLENLEYMFLGYYRAAMYVILKKHFFKNFIKDWPFHKRLTLHPLHFIITLKYADNLFLCIILHFILKITRKYVFYHYFFRLKFIVDEDESFEVLSCSAHLLSNLDTEVNISLFKFFHWMHFISICWSSQRFSSVE